MPDCNGTRDPDGERDAGDAAAGEPSPEEKGSGPRAVPRPSPASRGQPVPRPVRASDPVKEPPRATPVPSKASRDAPVPRPVRHESPALGTPCVDPDAPRPTEETSAPEAAGTIFETGPKTPPGGGRTVAPDAESWSDRISFSKVKKTTSPGTTQAVKTGPGDTRKLQFTRHTIRGEDRVTIRDDIEVVYRFLSSSGPDLYPDKHRGRLVDISLTGTQIEGPLPADPPERDLLSGVVLVRAKMDLPFVEKPLVVDSQVSWVKPGGGDLSLIGLRFAGLTQEQTNLIRGFFIGLQSPTRNKFRRGRR